jgi:RHS repeat-associated protein
LVDGEGRVTNAFERSAFGKLTAHDPRATTTTSRFEGQTADDECGLYYNRFRYYDPEAGTFISPDPFGLQAGENHYYYATNPISWIDPLGLWPHTCSCTLRDSNGNEWVPTSGMRRQSGGALEPGFVSGWAEDPNFPERENTEHRNRTTCHTERKAMEWAEANFSQEELDGARMSLEGRYPPCPQCHKHMMEFSKRGCRVDYSWPVNNRLRYGGGGASNPGGTNNGTALLDAYARNPNGTWVDYSDARQTYRNQTNALGPLGTF